MKLYNSLSRKVEEFKPQDPKRVKVYTCGPTVYSFAHIGNFTAYVYWDLLIRCLRLNGWQEDRVINITDVGHLTSDADDGEDKMEKGARREGRTVWQVAERYMNDFLAHYRALNMLEPTQICRATDFIDEDIALVEALDAKGYVYETSDGLYFDTSKFKSYADFARLDLDNLRAGARVEFNDEKRNVSDFALWKWVHEGEDHAMQWQYRGRAGYPGWHIECATIIHERLGETIDIHCGGVDHIPVHHTNEIAESEAAFGKQLSKCWLHNEFITIDGEKISKSLGNVYMFSDLEERGFTHLDYRMWVLQGHYQSERNFSFEGLAAAHQRLMNYRNFAALRWQRAATDMSAVQEKMTESLNNNLNSAQALAELDVAIKDNVPSEEFVKFLDEALGLALAEATPDLTVAQKQKLEQRQQARAVKDWAESDRLRDELLAEGVKLCDGAKEMTWQLLK